MDELGEFLKARWAEDEALARTMLELGHHLEGWLDPARVLREVEAKRRILELHVFGEKVCDRCSNDWHTETRPCLTLKLLAFPYSDHPDYREGWAV